MEISIISPTEKELLKQIEDFNDTDVTVWKFSNIIIPVVSIAISIMVFFVFKPNDKISFLAFINLLVNGAIPMIALNRIGGLGIYLFKYDKGKERELGIMDTYLLRTKLFYAFLGIIIVSITLYVYQVLNSPFSYTIGIPISLFFSLMAVYYSIKISKRVYLLQDRLIDLTFDQEIRNDMDKKGHGKKW